MAIFEDHRLSDAGIAKTKLARGALKKCLEELEELAGAHGREMSIVRTHLETACMYANRAIALNAVNHFVVEDEAISA